MNPSQKLELAANMRSDGNTWFKRADFTRATRRYSISINALALDQGYTAAEREAVRAEALLCFLNRAQCHLKNNKSKHARKDGDMAINIDGSNLKARFRRGLALNRLSLWKEAVTDLEMVVKAEVSA